MNNNFLDHQHNLRLRILVVDDEPDILELNTEVLKECGYLVDAITDGAAAWAALQCACYHLVVTDYNMPGLTGVQLIKKIREADMVLPIVMATGTLPVWEFARNPGLQPEAILFKPYTITELVSTVNEVLYAGIPAGVENRQPSPKLRRVG